MPGQSPDTSKLIEEILRLRRTEDLADPQVRGELRSVREFLEEIAGQTVSRAQAARLLGVSQTALDRWITKGEITAVVTPSGRREIPLSELLGLLEEIAQLGDRSGRPLASVLRERRRRSSDDVDLDRLIPRRGRRGHRVAELQALAYHRLIAERLTDGVVDDARRRLRRWRSEGRVDPRWAAEWERILELPRSRIAKKISADTKPARELRQTSPFAGALTEQERRRLLRAVEERVLA
jgi:DNA-binding transcriptional MerR regulator